VASERGAGGREGGNGGRGDVLNYYSFIFRTTTTTTTTTTKTTTTTRDDARCDATPQPVCTVLASL